MTQGIRAGQERMFRWIDDLPHQLQAARGYDGLAAVRPLATAPRQILVCGMGGSAMPGSLLADGWPGLTIPLLVHREPGLPAWVGPETMVLACSYSGVTAETMDAVRTARQRGCPVAAVTSGGFLLELAGEGVPVVQLPAGQPPRTALGASLGAQLHLLAGLGLLADPTRDIDLACEQAASGRLVCLDGAPEAVGTAEAAELARALLHRFTVIHTAGGEAHGPGRRLLAQLNENAKAPGHVAVFPELCHNEIVGWDLTPDQADRFVLLTLQGTDAAPSVAAGVDVSVDLLNSQFGASHLISARGPVRLARILGLILFGDLLSTHLAVLRGVDPVPIKRIDTLKSRLG